MAPTSSQTSSSQVRQSSIESFYDRDGQVVRKSDNLTFAETGDGYTEDELAAAIDPLSRKWNPEREYEELRLDQLLPGPKAVTFAGRIVYINRTLGRSQTHPKASGWHNLIVKDNSAAIAVKLYFAKQHYPLKLGQLITIWTSFVSDAAKAKPNVISGINLYANVFPGRVTSDHVMVHTSNSCSDICRTPLGYRKGGSLQGLISLESYVTNGGNDGVPDVKLLVCVKGIGARKRIVKKSGGESELADVTLCDHSGEIRLTVWNEIIDSVKNWQTNTTILLITSPSWITSQFSGRGKIGINKATMIEVDPDLPDAIWLRRHVTELVKGEAPCLEFPRDIWDLEASRQGVIRMLFTLKDIDEWARSEPDNVFSGFINIVIMEMSLVTLHRRNMLLCGSCCGSTLYANVTRTSCRNCSKECPLILNPMIIGRLVDETGNMAGGKLIWHNDAWCDLFGRSCQEVADMTIEEVRLFEQRVVFMRMHLCFGWSSSVGRLCIMGMMA